MALTSEKARPLRSIGELCVAVDDAIFEVPKISVEVSVILLPER